MRWIPEQGTETPETTQREVIGSSVTRYGRDALRITGVETFEIVNVQSPVHIYENKNLVENKS